MQDNIELLKNTCSWISELKMPLESIAKNSESRFIKLGQDLQAVYSDAEGLERLAVETTGMVSGDTDNDLLSKIRELAKGSLTRLEYVRSEVSELFPRFESCAGQIKRLNERCPGIIKISKTLNMVSFNISTESSRTAECEEMFNIFVREIRELAKRVNDISHRMKEDTEHSEKSQDNDFARILDRSNDLNRTADRAKDMVSENIRRIDEVMNMSVQTLHRSEVHTQKISGLVGEVVVAIQFHDIARQQIEHVIEAIQEMKSSINKEAISGGNDEANLILLGKAHSILRLQALQVEQVIFEISEAHRKITAAFEEIGNEAEALVDDVSLIGSGRTEGGNQDSAFNLLLWGFEKLEEIMAKGENLTEEIAETMKRTRASASNLSNYLSLIEELGSELHIKSINALIMSKKLGKNGVTLSVLAQYVTEVSRGADEFVSEVIDIIKTIQTSAQDLTFSYKRGVAPGSKGEMGTSLGSGINYISGSYDRFLKNVDLSRSCSMALKKKIMEVESGLAFLTEMKGRLEAGVNNIREIVGNLSPYASSDQEAVKDIAMVQSRYTMEVERGIHKRSIEYGDNKSKGINKGKSDFDNSELGENVELF